MPKPAKRTRSKKRSRTSSPGGRALIHYRSKKTETSRCAICRGPLHAVPRSRLAKQSKVFKTAKRPERVYGGKICPSCLRGLIKQGIRGMG